MRILITGASGQLGNELRRLLESGTAEIGPIPEEYRDAEVVYTDTPDLDITNEKAVMDAIKLGRYDLVINCAAMTNVDGCEANENTAKLVNAIGAWNLARATKEHGIPIVHVSTDYVFAGNEPGERVESDLVNPISAYGRTKLEGEKLVASANNRHHIVRTAWLYGHVGKNFAKTMLHLAESHDEVTVVNDQLGNPTSANDLAYEILKIALTNDYGIWHVTNEGTCSWADFAEAVLANTNCTVNRCTSQEYKAAHPESANRPAFSSLKNKHLESTIGNEMRPWQDALAEYMDKLAELGA
ncbi:dTDP-4-dehydrorhamnose reductase [Adlercreutzia sp. ZJ154]|uniref:dTDP-4-dehydrorhamnose reductase n=1 Tax=Adlercreutzia sp. ZJ154 TaxID=2709790 RepID=UPI0013EB5B45|nr:dTDP-4-dehydrorhamnose reductase [Adlercreutzia sp. ZJ154]